MYSRNCPICKKEIKYKTKYFRDSAELKKSICHSCNGIKNGWSIFNKKVSDGEIDNPFKNKLHTGSSKKKMSKSRLKNKELYKTKEFRQTMSRVTSGKNNPMYGKNIYDIWVQKYGIKEADKREKQRREKMSGKAKGKNNSMYGKPSPLKSGKGISGWFNGKYFRSLHELKFMIVCERFNLKYKSAENIRIKYEKYDGTERTYSPDFIVNEKYLVEVKPKRLFKTPLNLLKSKAAKKYCKENNLKYKILDFDIVYKNKLKKLINDNKIKLNVELK